MLLISCAAIPESIVKLRTGQDVAGVAVGFVGQDIASFGLLNLDILYIFLDDVAEKFGSGIRFRTEQDTAEKFLFLSANTGRSRKRSGYTPSSGVSTSMPDSRQWSSRSS